ILQILAWSLIPSFAGMAFSHVILSQTTLVRRLPLITGAALVVNIGLNLVLIPRMGNRGAAWSTLGTEAILAALYAAGAANFLFGRSETVNGDGSATLSLRLRLRAIALALRASPRGRGM